MKHERITEALYDWLVGSAPVEDLPLGSRLMRWQEGALKAPELAERWREAVDAFLDGIGAPQRRGEDLAFNAFNRPTPVTPGDGAADDGEEHRITPDGG